jgi:crotonobetainyl-CoA:carnitine CoA-transferase CaiB-like acyl-CoA transferase
VQGALGLRVLEIGDRLSGAFAGLLLAAQGASVCQWRDGLHRRLDATESAWLDRGRLILDGTGDVRRLAALADVVISDSPTAGSEIPVDETALSELRPGLVHVVVSPMGRQGPQSGFLMESVTEWAAGGLAYVSRRDVPDEDTEGYTPLNPPGRQPERLAGLVAALGALAAVRLARRSGRSVVVDVSRQEVMAALLHNVFPQLVSNTLVAGDPSHRVVYGMLAPTADGVAYFRPLEAHQWEGLVEWMGSPEWAVAMLENMPDQPPDFQVFELLMSDWTRPQRCQELLDEGQRRRVPVSIPSDMAGLLGSEQLAARDFWTTVDLDGRPVRAPKVPLLEPERWPASRRLAMADVEAEWAGPTPLDGAHPAPVHSAPVDPAPAQSAPVHSAPVDPAPAQSAPAQSAPDQSAPGPDDTAPLAGLRVLDLGWSWSAPFAGMVMADMGAEVIKVESRRRIDVLRYSGAFVDGVRDPERSGYYLACNRGKQSVTIDLKAPAGRELLLSLVERCDVVLENFSPRVLPGLGIGYETLAARRPGLVMVSMSGYGATGPQRSYISYGDHLLHASGFSSLTGREGDRYTKLGTFYGDPVGGLYATLAVLAALRERDRTGAGAHLDLSQLEGLVSLLPTEVMATDLGRSPLRRGDKSAAMSPHGFYRCAGDDTWVALTAADDTAWSRLRLLLRDDGFAVDDLATLEERFAAEDHVDKLLRTWTASRTPWEITAACQAAGVAAYPVQSTARLMWDEHLAARQFFTWVHRPVTGPGPLTGLVLRVGDDGSRVRGYAPLLGESNEAVILGLLEMPEDAYEHLVESGAIG